jgi:tight adherence protein C
MVTGTQDMTFDPLTTSAALLSGLAVLIVVTGLRTYLAQTRLDAWLQTFIDDSSGDAPVQRTAPWSLHGRLAPFLAMVGRRVDDLLPARAVARMRADLVSAGYPSRRDLSDFLAAKAVLAVLLGMLGVSLPLLLVQADIPVTVTVPLAVIGLLVGFYLPGIWLQSRIKGRRLQLSRNLPDALDLLAISVRAGLGFDGALAEVVQGWRTPLSEELGVVQRDMRLGKTRREALRAFNDRANVPEVSSLVAAVVQAEELGTPMRDALRQLSEQMRQQRRQKAEERARQAVIKMLIPMVLFIFPAIFIVLLGPTIPIMMALGGGG